MPRKEEGVEVATKLDEVASASERNEVVVECGGMEVAPSVVW